MNTAPLLSVASNFAQWSLTVLQPKKSNKGQLWIWFWSMEVKYLTLPCRTSTAQASVYIPAKHQSCRTAVQATIKWKMCRHWPELWWWAEYAHLCCVHLNGYLFFWGMWVKHISLLTLSTAVSSDSLLGLLSASPNWPLSTVCNTLTVDNHIAQCQLSTISENSINWSEAIKNITD